MIRINGDERGDFYIAGLRGTICRLGIRFTSIGLRQEAVIFNEELRGWPPGVKLISLVIASPRKRESDFFILVGHGDRHKK